MNDSREPIAAPLSSPAPSADPNVFVRRLAVATLGLLLLVLVLFILREFKVILQPLFIAVFLGYIILPVHKWLVARGVPGLVAFGLMLGIVLGILFGLGILVYNNLGAVIEQFPDYQKRVQVITKDALASLPFELPDPEEFLQALGSRERIGSALRTLVGTFVDFFTALAITFVYLLFLVAEKIGFPRRIILAFGEAEGKRVLEVVDTINQAIAEYLAVKTFISFLAGALSFVVLWAFKVDFFIMWSILILVLNYIPYLGSLVAIAFPILLSFLQYDDPGRAVIVAGALIGIQVVLGNFVEPRMAGRRLGVSPLLIVLSLSFWGLVWGIVGMILAVPLLVSIKIVLDNIEATKPLATLMSNI